MADKLVVSLFAWDMRYSLGEPRIDAEHQRLFAIADRLHTAMLEGEGGQAVRQTLADLIDYTREHFRHEEDLMQLAGYPELAAHKAIHEDLTRKVLEHQKALERGRFAPSVALLPFLKDWLTRHICECDRRIVTHLEKDRSGSHASRL
jgi:hemerythrin